MTWEQVETNLGMVHRAKVPGGWMVLLSAVGYGGVLFYPDPEYRWRVNVISEDASCD